MELELREQSLFSHRLFDVVWMHQHPVLERLCMVASGYHIIGFGFVVVFLDIIGIGLFCCMNSTGKQSFKRRYGAGLSVFFRKELLPCDCNPSMG